LIVSARLASGRSARMAGSGSSPYLDTLAQSHLPVDAGDVRGLSIDYVQSRKEFVVHRSIDPAVKIGVVEGANDSCGEPEPGGPFREPWKAAVAPRPSIPNLDHTGVRTPFTYHGPTFLRPDGSISGQLREVPEREHLNVCALLLLCCCSRRAPWCLPPHARTFCYS